MRIVSLGAGVQSTTLLLMVKHGQIEADCAIFADTQGEPAAVYKHLDWLEKEASIPVYRVTRGDLRQDTLDSLDGSRTAPSIPVFMRTKTESGAMIQRQCTKNYKVAPVRKKARQLMREAGVKHATMLMGISLDEIQRMRDSAIQSISNEYPLVDFRMDRGDCLMWLQRWNYPRPPKSACTFCPLVPNSRWRAIREVPAEWASVVDFDKSIRHNPHFKGEVFLHPSLTPLDEVDLSTLEDHGQQNWLTECEGMCGV